MIMESGSDLTCFAAARTDLSAGGVSPSRNRGFSSRNTAVNPPATRERNTDARKISVFFTLFLGKTPGWRLIDWVAQRTAGRQ